MRLRACYNCPNIYMDMVLDGSEAATASIIAYFNTVACRTVQQGREHVSGEPKSRQRIEPFSNTQMKCHFRYIYICMSESAAVYQPSPGLRAYPQC